MIKAKLQLLIPILLAISGVAHAQDAAPVQISYLVAFIGGMISLLSPCSAAVIPAFFAYSFKEKTQLVKKSLVFFIGLSIPLVLLGLSASIAGRFLNMYREQFVVVAGTLMITFGVMALLGRGFSLPGTRKFAQKNAGKKGVFAFGILFGIGFAPCAGPILGAILTLAATSSSALQGALMLEVYALGIMVPVFLLAYFFDKKHIASISKTIKIGKKEFYWTNLVSGVLFILLGLMFIFFGGPNFLNAAFLPGLFDLNNAIQSAFSGIPDYVFIGLITTFMIFYLYSKKKIKL